MSLTISQSHDPFTLTLSGRLDTHTAPDLDRELDRVLPSPGLKQIVFNVSNLEYLSSAGIRCLVRARKAVEPKGGRVVLVNPQPGVRKVLDIVKAMPRSDIFNSVAEFDAYLHEMQRQVNEAEADKT
jgi:anti-anti-sigma factor